jgi:hypothetical protein
LGVFTGLAVNGFPSEAQRFDLFASLTDSFGVVTVALSIIHMETNEEIYSQQMDVQFPDPLQVVNLRFRVRQLRFDTAGTFLFALSVDDHEIAARRVRVYQTGA